MSEQAYVPYRQTLLSRDELTRLSQMRFGHAARDTAWLWFQIVTAWAIAASSGSVLVHVMCACVVGNRYYSLFILGHDGLHRRIHPKTLVNDLWTDLFLIGPLGAVVRLNRKNHMRHHRTLNLEVDPDHYKYESRRNLSPLHFWFSLSGLPFVLRAVGNVYASKPAAKGADNSSTKEADVGNAKRHSLRDFLILGFIQAALVSGLMLTFGWWGYLAMWLIPVYTFTFCADMLRVFCEHSAEEGTDQPDLCRRLVMFESNPLETRLFAPMNMHHHITHHLWPSIPYYHLPEATAIMKARLAEPAWIGPKPVFRGSFSGYLARYASRCVAKH